MSFRCSLICGGALTLVGSAAAEPRLFARGFVRQPHNFVAEVASVTQEMRAAAPASLDWSAEGALTGVKDQGQCGSCWAFSAVEGIESALFMATGESPPALSTQQIAACDKDEADGGGCDGGDLAGAFAYVMKAGGIDSEEHYPDTSHTTGRTGFCNWDGNKVATVLDWKHAIPPCAESEQAEGGDCANQDEDGLKAALHSFGPLSVCLNAASSWDYYSGGVLSGSCSGAWNKLNHCVQLVGYDTTASTPYWKVRNSWGTSWGEKGFIRLPMGINSCGIADEVAFVNASMAPPAPPSPPPPESAIYIDRQDCGSDNYCWLCDPLATVVSGQCAVDYGIGAYVIFECSADGKEVTRSEYNDASCTDLADSKKVPAGQCGVGRGAEDLRYGTWTCFQKSADLELV